MNKTIPEININEFHKLDLIGSGIFGRTFKIIKKSTGKIYIAKILKTPNDNDYQKNIKRLLHSIQNIDCPSINLPISFSKTDFDSNNFYVLIKKYMKNGSLFDLFIKLHEKSDIPKGWNNTKLVINILGISIGMKYLDDFGFWRKNLKPSNILLDSKLYPKITDFENYLHFEEKIIINNPIYIAPEHYDNTILYHRSDIFSFGIILYEFYSGCPLVEKDRTIPQIIRSISSGEGPDVNKLPEGPIRDPGMSPTFDEIITFYIRGREIFWPDDVDEEEVKEYLNTLGYSLNDYF